MLPKGKFSIASSKSRTDNPLEASVQWVKGVGPQWAARFARRDIHTIRDLLLFFPRTYEDRSVFREIHELSEGEDATLNVHITGHQETFIPKLRRSLLQVTCSDPGAGILILKWFHVPPGLSSRLKVGASVVVTGKVKLFRGVPEIVHPELTWDTSVQTSTHTGRVVPIYPELEGIPHRTLRQVLWEAVEKYSHGFPEILPSSILERWKFPKLGNAIRWIHFPPATEEYSLSALKSWQTPAHRRFIYEEFFKFEYFMLEKKRRLEHLQAFPCGGTLALEWLQKQYSHLPFELTLGQKKALSDLLKDLQGSFPMNRLIQGDVGAGKTIVAFLSAGCILAEGGQVALMVPTEILAEQHHQKAISLFQDRLKTALWTGSTSAQQRVELQKQLDQGEPLLLIGTHALIQENVRFSRLRYVIIDEQHRFGVEQRKLLKEKGAVTDAVTQKLFLPHFLLMTATPIPRTLALTAFGELDVSTIQDLPPGRSPVRTLVVQDRALDSQVYARITRELQQGRQAFFIYPLIQESEAEGFTHLKAAMDQATFLQEEIFPAFAVGLLHGQLSAEEKEEIMGKFQRKEFHILVSTTVVEVGVDIPNASVMVIEHAERFGLSQLHQLRGRVGRGSFQSYCYLFSHRPVREAVNSNTQSRLKVLEETTDGFQIAEADLAIRGPGEFLGTRQAGILPFQGADLVRDQEWLFHARDDVQGLMQNESQHRAFRDALAGEDQARFGGVYTP